MCNTAPGLRCWADSSKRATTLQTRARKAHVALADVQERKREAAESNSYSKYESLRKQEAKLVRRVEDAEGLIRANQRDMDGTKTGRNRLDELIAAEQRPKELAELKRRRVQADVIHFQRSHAAKTVAEGRVPLLRIAA